MYIAVLVFNKDVWLVKRRCNGRYIQVDKRIYNKYYYCRLHCVLASAQGLRNFSSLRLQFLGCRNTYFTSLVLAGVLADIIDTRYNYAIIDDSL